MAEQADETVYEARFGFTVRGVLVVVISVVFVVLGVVFDVPLFLQILLIVFFGGGGLVFLAQMLSRRVALRVDGTGITLGGSPLHAYRRTTAVVPWSDITAVVLFSQKVGYGNSLHYVGVRRREDAPDLPGLPGSGMRGANERLIPHVPQEVVAASRPINGWSLDRAQLKEVVAHHAPDVQVQDLG
ncbi:hypothetical protein [Nocardia callitridis]|uniref:PH domain-containing protein n=1 Tax=Nocardia callitridis TaxID=648753 RepID=A0ABP9KU17_9NOCA